MVLLVAMKERVAGVRRHQVCLDLRSCFYDHDVLAHTACGRAADRNQFEVVPVKMNRMVVDAAIIKDQTMPQPFVQNNGVGPWDRISR